MMDEEEYMQDEGVIKYYKDQNLWGMVCHIDLFGCNSKITDRGCLTTWVFDLIDVIDMNAVGFPTIQYLAPTRELSGYSLMQLIETSSITGHFCDATHSAYIDIFSCKPFGPNTARLFCERFFGAEKSMMQVTFRRKDDDINNVYQGAYD